MKTHINERKTYQHTTLACFTFIVLDSETVTAPLFTNGNLYHQHLTTQNEAAATVGSDHPHHSGLTSSEQG